MLEFVLDVLEKIRVAAAVAILGWIPFVLFRLPFVYRDRRRLFDFFGITKDNTRLIMYLSTVYVIPGGSVDFKGTPRSFSGPAIPAAEISTIEPIARLFRDPLLENLPATVRRWLGERGHWSFQNVTPVISSSPKEPSHVERGSILAVGSQYYNSAADLYTESLSPILRMEQDGQRMVIRVKQGSRKGDVFEQRRGQDDDLAIVEKRYDTATKSTVLFAAGLGVTGTMGAVNYIADNWGKLADQFGTTPFAICLRFQDVKRDPMAFKRPIELSRFQKE